MITAQTSHVSWSTNTSTVTKNQSNVLVWDLSVTADPLQSFLTVQMRRVRGNPCKYFLYKEKLEYINRVCSRLKILLLQDNCIGRIENLGRLKSLEYLNLAMNNVERLENLGPLESLKRLDLTLNFIGTLIPDLEEMRRNKALEELMLMGNPCAKFEGYREFVVATLPQLRVLDGVDVQRYDLKSPARQPPGVGNVRFCKCTQVPPVHPRSERIKAVRRLPQLRPQILRQQQEHVRMREEQRLQGLREIEDRRKQYEDPNKDPAENRRAFYRTESRFVGRTSTQRVSEYFSAILQLLQK